MNKDATWDSVKDEVSIQSIVYSIKWPVTDLVWESVEVSVWASVQWPVAETVVDSVEEAVNE